MKHTLTDPTADEMREYLRDQFAGLLDDDEGERFVIEGAIYWFASHYHGGQASNLYSALSTSEFRPGPLCNGPESETAEADLYDALVSKFA